MDIDYVDLHIQMLFPKAELVLDFCRCRGSVTSERGQSTPDSQTRAKKSDSIPTLGQQGSQNIVG
jgi:hypothetical protein